MSSLSYSRRDLVGSIGKCAALSGIILLLLGWIVRISPTAGLLLGTAALLLIAGGAVLMKKPELLVYACA